MRPSLPGWALLACGALLVSCGSTPTTSTGTTSARDALYFTTTSLPVGYVSESYAAAVVVAGGAGPYSMRVATGTLPPGLSLRNREVIGTPTKAGAYTFSLETSDANLSTKVQSYTLNVSELPALTLKPQLPTGELRGETRIPLNITAPRSVRAARMVWDLPQGVTVTRVQLADADGVLFWKQAGSKLTLDLGFKAVPRSGARVALISLKPQKAVTLSTTGLALEARDGEGKLLTEKAIEKAAEAPRAAATSTPINPSNGRTGAGPTTAPTPPASGTPAAGAAATPGSPTAPATGGTASIPGTAATGTGTATTGTTGTDTTTTDTTNPAPTPSPAPDPATDPAAPANPGGQP